MKFAAHGLRVRNRGRRLPRVTLNVDSMPIDVQGHQPKAEWNGHYHARVYQPLIASIAKTSDMLVALIRPGNVGIADGALNVIVDVDDDAQNLCRSPSQSGRLFRD